MYLFIYVDGRARQVIANLTVTDLLAIKQKLLSVYTVINDKFYKLVIDEGKLCKVPVQESIVLACKDGICHHT